MVLRNFFLSSSCNVYGCVLTTLFLRNLRMTVRQADNGHRGTSLKMHFLKQLKNIYNILIIFMTGNLRSPLDQLMEFILKD